jgi:hypothetical protein
VLKIAALAALLITTCALAPEGGEPWTPPPSYRAQWDSAQACTGQVADFDKVSFYLVPGHDFPCPSGRCIGEWVPPHSIYMAEEWKNIGWVIRHEMIHEITKYEHDGERGKPGPRDVQIWGIQCKATWGYLGDDPNYKP